MHARVYGVLTSLALLVSLSAHAQAPAGAPAGSTGQCKDGTYSSAASKSGACRGHQGVQAWYTATATTPARPAAKTSPASPSPKATPAPAPVPKSPSPTPAPAATPGKATAPQAAAQRTPAAGGGNGQVWVNTASNVYHCQGDRNYGKTKTGAYMSESDARAKGARPADNKPCSR